MARKEIGYAEDPEAGGYEWALARCVIEENGHFAIYEEQGCSCSSPGDSDGWVAVGPAATLGGLFDELNVDSKKHNSWVKEAFLNALETINKETMAAARKALGL